VPDVISDTSVIQYLFQVGLLDLLFTLYQEITIPEAVAGELAEGRLHGIDLPDAETMSQFRVLKILVPQSIQLLKSLGPGEREVLALASASQKSLMLLDDAVARHHARKLGLRFTGTPGVLLKAKQSGALIEIRSILNKLEGKGFRLDKKTRSAMMSLAGEISNEG
jgi:predicted nucleic acid-binding protein